MNKTLITAHSGAENTVDNTLESIRVMADCGADVIEIDVRLHGGALVMSHDAPEAACDALEDAFEIVRAHPGLRMNIDLKQSGIVSAVADLAVQCGVEDRLLFTGAVGEEDFAAVRERGLTVWYNNDAMPEDADWLAGVDALGFGGLNLHHGDVTDALLQNADRLSVWTVDDEALLRKFLAAGVMGITTRKPVLALKLRDEIQKGSPSMKFVTFNIRCDWGQDGENCFDNRKPLILNKIAAEQPDILCFQEVRPHQALWLKESLTEYTVIGCGRGAVLDDEQMTVAFRKERYNLIEMRTFWLSETPYVPGSRYEEQSECPRSCTEAVLMEYATGKVFRVLNTHLDHIGAGARKLGLKQILEHLGGVQLFPDAPVILCGDFNAWPDGEEMTVFDDYPEYVNATAGIGITYHGYMKAEHPESIDYIFLKGSVSCARVEKWTDEQSGVFLSDHYPVSAELTLG